MSRETRSDPRVPSLSRPLLQLATPWAPTAHGQRSRAPWAMLAACAHSSQPRVNTPASALCYPPRAGHRTVVLDSGVFHAEGQRAVRSVQAHTPHKQSTSAQSEGGVHGPLLACKAPGSRCPRHKLLITGAWAAERPQIVIDLACRRRQPGTPASAHAA